MAPFVSFLNEVRGGWEREVHKKKSIRGICLPSLWLSSSAITERHAFNKSSWRRCGLFCLLMKRDRAFQRA